MSLECHHQSPVWFSSLIMAIPFHGVTTVFHVKILNESLSVTAVLTGRQIYDLIYLFSGGPVVWAGRFHCQYGDLWSGRGGQVGQQPGDAQQAVLQAALHPGLRILHQGSVRHLRWPLQRLHPRQLARGLQILSRFINWEKKGKIISVTVTI